MVVLVIVTNTNGETVNFQEVIPKVDFMKVVSCSLYNSWHTLKKQGTATMVNERKPPDVSQFPRSHHNLESLAKEMKRMFAQGDNLPVDTEINTRFCQLIARNSETRSIMFDKDLESLLRVDRLLACSVTKINLSFPTTYFIHCDLIDKQKNLLNGKMSDITAKFTIAPPLNRLCVHAAQASL